MQVSGKVKILTGGTVRLTFITVPCRGPRPAKAADPGENPEPRLKSGWKKRGSTLVYPHQTIPKTTTPKSPAKSMTRPDNAHSTGVADSGRWSTKRIAMYALFVAPSMAVSFVEFPIVPGVEWLKYDPSGIVSLVAGFAYGPAAAVIVSVLGFLPHLFTNPWGTLMAGARGFCIYRWCRQH